MRLEVCQTRGYLAGPQSPVWGTLLRVCTVRGMQCYNSEWQANNSCLPLGMITEDAQNGVALIEFIPTHVMFVAAWPESLGMNNLTFFILLLLLEHLVLHCVSECLLCCVDQYQGYIDYNCW